MGITSIQRLKAANLPAVGVSFSGDGGKNCDLLTATQANKEDLVRNILSVNPDQRFDVDDEGRTALHLATEYGYCRIAQLILSTVKTGSEQCGQLLDAQDTRGQTVLHLACNTRREDLATLYISLGARLDLCDHAGNIALHRAVRVGLATTTALLCAAGADVNASNALLWTPLHEVARTGDETLMTELINRGARTDAVAHNGMTPFLTAFFYFKIASRTGSGGIGAYLNLETVWRHLINAGCPLSHSDGHWTPLSAALACDSCLTAAALLLNGCHIDRTSQSRPAGRGLLQETFASSEPMLAKLLVLLGYIPTPDEVAYCGKQIPMYSRILSRLPGRGSSLQKDRQDVVVWLRERIAAPPSLLECCRTTIRATVNVASKDSTIIERLNQLPIPNRLKQFLNMSDFTHYLLD